MKNIGITQWNRRPFIYSLIISIGFVILVYLLDNFALDYFIWGAVVLSLAFVLEMFFTIRHGQQVLSQYKLPPLETSLQLANIIKHFVLPLLFFISFLSFIFFHTYIITKYLLSFLIFVVLYLVFTNIKAFYEDKFKIEIATHYVYDLISVFTFFTAIDSIINYAMYNSVSAALAIIIISVFIILYLLITLLRYFEASLIIPTAIVLVAKIAVLILGMVMQINSLKIALILSLVLYFFLAYIHHHRENTKSMKVFEEYFVISLIAIVLIIFN